MLSFLEMYFLQLILSFLVVVKLCLLYIFLFLFCFEKLEYNTATLDKHFIIICTVYLMTEDGNLKTLFHFHG